MATSPAASSSGDPVLNNSPPPVFPLVKKQSYLIKLAEIIEEFKVIASLQNGERLRQDLTTPMAY